VLREVEAGFTLVDVIRERVRADASSKGFGGDLRHAARLGTGAAIARNTKDGRLCRCEVREERCQEELRIGGIASRVGHPLRRAQRFSVVEF
jgi:hypothetical protein